MDKVIVVGGGAAGIMAAISAAESGDSVLLIEKNEKLGKKVYITGKGRCNITNDSDVENLLKNVRSNPKFLYSAFYTFDSYRMMDFLESEGLKIKTERGNRVFPESDKSSDVIRTLKKALEKGITHAIFKAKSPSCGVDEIYDGTFTRTLVPGDGVAVRLFKEAGIRVATEDTFKKVFRTS